MMKKTIAVVLLLSLALALLSACGGGASSVSMFDLNKAMCAATDEFGEMKYASSADDDADGLFANVSSMDYSKVAGFFVTYAASGKGNADEIVVIEVKNKADVNEAADSLRAHLENRRALYATYDTTQVKKLEDGRVLTSGSLAALVVADDADEICRAFSAFVKGGEEG